MIKSARMGMKMISEKETLKRRAAVMILISLFLAAVSVILAILANNGFAIPCIFNKVTGLYCPGCGNTRAAISLLKFDFLAAFYYNPLFLLEFLYIGWIYLSCSVSYIKGSGFAYHTKTNVPDICILTIILVWGIIRNVI